MKYQDESSVQVAQHLTNTVFIDRALIVVPLGDGELDCNSTIENVIEQFLHCLTQVRKFATSIPICSSDLF